jgi:hypothetical protein
LRPFSCGANRVSPRVRRIVECRGVDDGPVQEINPGIVRIAVGVEDIDRRELADGYGHVVGRLCSPELIGARAERPGLAAKVETLPEEEAVQTEVRLCLADLVGFPTREAGYTEGGVKTEALVDLGIDAKRAAIPKPDAQV